MPVKSLNSSVLKWPDRATVDSAVRSWARKAAALRPDILSLGYFGSYARGDWGVGSDLDLIAVLEAVSEPFERRALAFCLDDLPVPSELIVYSKSEWLHLNKKGTKFAVMLENEVVWVYHRYQNKQ